MLELELQIVLDESADSGLPVRGWYLPTTSIAEWIDVLNGVVSGADYRLFIAPNSVRDIRASGLIYLASATEHHSIGNSANALPKSQALDVPLGAIGLVGMRSRSGIVEIWMPSNARPEPAISSSQLAAEFEDCEPRNYVWLPSIGLTEFEPMDAIAVTRLLRTPSFAANTSSRSWTALPDAEQLPDRIVEIVFPMTEPFEDLFEQEQDEIGGESSQLGRIDEHGNAGSSNLLGKLQEFISRQIENWIRERDHRQQQKTDTSKTSGKPLSGIFGLNLTGGLMNQMSKMLQSQRDKQIDKLLKLMQTDPDKALRFAIPLAAMSAFRGLGRPGNQLKERKPDFSLSGLFGSGPVDPWSFNEKIHNQLQTAYRMQADRELAAGRFRRAAYIHAHLLGDLTAAATILERAKAFREAAVIYGDKLKRPRDQARCLALAGQPNQAAALYEELKDFESAAKVWEEVADDERARLAYTKAVELKIANHQILAASKLLDEKLDDRVRAESLLWEQWPDGQEVLGCAELGFRWFAESGDHSLARDKFEKLVERIEKRNRLLLAKLSAGLARQYPEQQLREIAEDRCRVVAGCGLRDVSEQEMMERLGLIRSLHEDDVLLRRDTARFEVAEKSRGIKLQPVASNSRVKLNPIPTVRLPDLGEYLCGEMLDGELFALVRAAKTAYAVRAADLPAIQCKTVYSRLLNHALCAIMKFGCIYHRDATGWQIDLSFRGIKVDHVDIAKLDPPLGGWAWQICHNPLDITEHPELCGGFGQDGTRWSVTRNPFVLHGYSSSNLVTRNILSPITKLLGDQSFDPICKMLVSGNCPIIAVGELLIKYSGGAFTELCALGGTPNCMAASLPHTAPRIAIATDNSLKVVWLDRGDRVETICDFDRFTHVCFVHGGKLLATTETHLHLYNLYQGNSKTVLRLDRQPLQSHKVAAVMSITAELVGVLYQNGIIERYRIK